jgi:hypothetical protein
MPHPIIAGTAWIVLLVLLMKIHQQRDRRISPAWRTLQYVLLALAAAVFAVSISV